MTDDQTLNLRGTIFTEGEANNMELKFCARILQNENMDAAYVEVPYDIKELFGKGSYKTDAQADRQELW